MHHSTIVASSIASSAFGHEELISDSIDKARSVKIVVQRHVDHDMRVVAVKRNTLVFRTFDGCSSAKLELQTCAGRIVDTSVDKPREHVARKLDEPRNTAVADHRDQLFLRDVQFQIALSVQVRICRERALEMPDERSTLFRVHHAEQRVG